MAPTALSTTVHEQRTQGHGNPGTAKTPTQFIPPEPTSSPVPEEHDLPNCLGSVAPRVAQELQE